MGYLERNSETWKTPNFQVLNVGFRVLVGFQFSGSGRVRVAKMSGYSPGFRVFGFKYPSLSRKKVLDFSLQSIIVTCIFILCLGFWVLAAYVGEIGSMDDKQGFSSLLAKFLLQLPPF